MISMKGLELPLSTLAVIILVLVVLVALIGLFYTTWPPSSQTATLETVKNNACQMLSSIGGCDPLNHDKTKLVVINNFDADKDGATDGGPVVDFGNPNSCTSMGVSQDNLFKLCECWYGITGAPGNTEDDLNDNCKENVCKCPT